MSSLPVRAIIVVVWLLSLFAAFQIGKRSVSSPPLADHGKGRAPGADGATSADAGGDGRSAQISKKRNGALGTRVAPGAANNESGSAPVSNEMSDSSTVDVAKLVADMRNKFSTGSAMMFNSSAMMKIMAPIAELSEEQLFQALDEVSATVSQQQQKAMFNHLLISRLAEIDGEAAMRYIAENFTEQERRSNGISMSTMASWAQREPDKAWQWFIDNRDSQPSGQAGDNQLQFLFSGMAAQDIGGAFRRLNDIDEFEQKRAISGIAMSAGWNEEVRGEMLELGADLPTELRDTLYQGVFSQWASGSPEEAIDWVRGLPEADRKKISQSGSWSLMYANPRLGAEFMLENATGEELPGVYANVVGNWASQDPNAAGEWLNEQPQGPELDDARARFSQTVAERDPFSAMEWAKTVETESSREQAVRNIYNLWYQKNPQEADQSLDASGLNREQIDKIRGTVVRAAESPSN